MPSRLIYLVFLILATIPLSAQTPSPQPQAVRLATFLERLQQRHDLVGFSLIVLQNGQKVAEIHQGHANLELNVSVSSDSVFPLYSVSKLFANIIVMQLVEAEKIDLDAPIATYLNDLPVAWQPITVRQTLSHLSGLPEMYQGDQALPDLEQDVLPSLDKTLAFEPGTRNSYNQTNYWLIRRIIETQTGEPYHQTVTQRIIEPAGLKSVKYGDPSAIVPNRVTSYQSHNNRLVHRKPWQSHPYFYANNGLNAGANDLARWFQALQRGTFLTPASLKAMWQEVKRKDGSPSLYANGWFYSRSNGITAVGHDGAGTTRFQHFIRESDQQSVTVIFLTNGYRVWLPLYETTLAIAGIFMQEAQPPRMALKQRLFEAAMDGNWATVTETYIKFRKNPKWAKLETEDTLEYLGFDLMNAVGLEQAMPVFQLNADHHPQSANCFLNLGIAHLRTGNAELGVQKLKHGLSLAKADPDQQTLIPVFERQLASAHETQAD